MVPGEGMRSAVTFSISWTKDCDWLKTIFTSLTPPCFLPSPSHQTLDGMQGPDHRCSLAPRGYSVCVYVGVCVCACAHALYAWVSFEGRDPGYVVEVSSGQGPDRTRPPGGSSADPIGQITINQPNLSRPQLTTSNARQDHTRGQLFLISCINDLILFRSLRQIGR